MTCIFGSLHEPVPAVTNQAQCSTLRKMEPGMQLASRFQLSLCPSRQHDVVNFYAFAGALLILTPMRSVSSAPELLLFAMKS